MSSKNSTLIRLTARTDKGEVRYHNEDNFLVGANLSTQDWAVQDDVFETDDLGSLLVVADGMGGANAGEVASQIAIQEVKNYFSIADKIPPQSDTVFFKHLNNAVFQAHKSIISYASDNPDCNGMGTTLLLVWVVNTRAYIGWSGDSRCYKYNPTIGLKLLIDDHSLVWEMVKKGELTEDEAAVHEERNIITQSLGAESYPPKPDFVSLELVEGDRLLLCSDGLNSMLLDSEIKKVLDQSNDIGTNSRQLIEAANLAGGEDNVTVIIYELLEANNVAAFGKITETNLPHSTRTTSYNWVWALLVLLLFIGSGLGYWWWNKSQISIPKIVAKDSTTINSVKDTAVIIKQPPIFADTSGVIAPIQNMVSKKELRRAKQDKRYAEEQQRVNRMIYDRFIAERDDIESQMSESNKLTKITNDKATENAAARTLANRKKTLDEKISVQDLMIKEKQSEINQLNLLLKNDN